MGTPRAPDFICIGASKTGTSWLYRQLRSSPGYWMPPVKELRYFGHANIGERDKDRLEAAEASPNTSAQVLEWMRRYVNGTPKDDAWYLSLFASAADNKTGEISPAYAPLALRFIQQAKRLAPDAIILIFVRNPFERNVSHLANLAARTLLGPKNGKKYQDSGATLTADMLRAEIAAPVFIRQSQQALAIRQWREVFGDQVKVFLYDDLVADSFAFLECVTRAIGHQSRPADDATVLDCANPMLSVSAADVAKVKEAIRPMCEVEIESLIIEVGAIPNNWNQPCAVDT
jgi:hypothetical protein